MNASYGSFSLSVPGGIDYRTDVSVCNGSTERSNVSAGLARALALVACLWLVGCPRDDNGSGHTVPAESGRPSSGASPSDSTGSVEALLADARRLGRERREHAAIDRLKAALATVPEDAKARVWKTISEFQLAVGAHENAVTSARKAVELDASSVDSTQLLAESLRRVEQNEEAERLLTKLLQGAPNHAPAKLTLARIRFRTASPRDALPLFEAYLSGAAPDDADRFDALLEYGRALYRSGRAGESIDRLAGLLEERPMRTAVYSELAKAFYRAGKRKQGKFVEAIYRDLSQNAFEEHVSDGLRRTGRESLAFSQEALQEEKRGHPAAALRWHRQASKLNESDARVAIYHADYCSRIERATEGIAVIEAALAKGCRPTSGLWQQRASCEMRLERWRDAEKSLRRALDELAKEGDLGGPEYGQANRPGALQDLAIALFESGDPNGSAGVLATLEQSGSDHWPMWLWRGRVALAREDYAAALQCLSAASEKGGKGSRDVELWAAACRGRQGAKQEAYEVLVGLGQANPGHLPIYDELLSVVAGDASREAQFRGLQNRAQQIDREMESLRARFAETPLEESAALYFRLGELHRMSRTDHAATFLVFASDLDPTNPQYLAAAASQFRRSDEIFVRLHYLRRLLAAAPQNDAAIAGLASLYVQLEVRLGEAEKLARQFHQRRPSPDSYALLAKALRANGKTEEAAKVLRDGEASFPGHEKLRAVRAEASQGAPTQN